MKHLSHHPGFFSAPSTPNPHPNPNQKGNFKGSRNVQEKTLSSN